MLMTAAIALAMSAPTMPPPATPRLDRACGDMSAFSMPAFRKPDSFFAPSAMWIWNDVLSEQKLREQLRDMAAVGMMGAMPLDEPKEFRPAWMPTRTEPEYLSPGFFDLIKATVDEGDRLGMRVWLYDEGGWPSGSVCGRLVREHPQFARRILRHDQQKLVAGATAVVPNEALAAWLADGGTKRRVQPGERVEAGTGGAVLDVYCAPAGGGYTDLLSPDAVDTFIHMTHDAYLQAVGGKFGSTVPMFFTDEPQASATPWTDGLAEDFRKTYGYDLVERIPSIFEQRTDDDRRVRIDYYDWWSRRFADVYLGRIQQWCRTHGILSTGHLNGEDETMGAVKYGFGNLMRCMRRLDVPGVDVIWRQLWPGQANGDFPKHASSVAHQEGLRWAMSESFAVYGSGLTPEQMKWVTDYQLVRGITHFDVVGYPYSTSDWLAGGERPHFDAEDPQHRWMPIYNAYASRLGYALSTGKSGARTALYFPIRDIWSGGQEAEAAGAAFDKACRELLEAQCDFDLIDDDVLARDGTRIDGRALVVGEMRYETVVIPPCRWMPEASRARLSGLAQAGGHVLALNPLGGAALPDGVVPCIGPALEARLDRCVLADERLGWLRALTRDTASGRLVFLTNEETAGHSCRITVPSSTRPLRLDPVTGEAHRIEDAKRINGGWQLALDLPFAGSLLLLCPSRSVKALPDTGRPGEVICAIPGPWTVKPEASVELTGTEIRWVRHDGAAAKPGELGDWSRALGEAYSGHAVYEAELVCSVDEARKAQWLDLGAVKYMAQVEINGQPAGSVCWAPWAVPVKGLLKAGANRVRITVGNTMANQYLRNKALDRWKPNQLGPYHPRALQFEPDSLLSGLWGPVWVRGK